MTVIEKSSSRLSIRRAHGRATNAVAELLRTKLSVPQIYLEPKISGISSVDILAVDRAGSGDLHAVEIKVLSIFPTRSQLRTLVAPLKLLPFHYRYLAVPGSVPTLSDASKLADYSELFDESGFGRIGIISFNPNILAPSSVIDSNSVAITVRPERFRVNAQHISPIERFISRKKPDMEVRI